MRIKGMIGNGVLAVCWLGMAAVWAEEPAADAWSGLVAEAQARWGEDGARAAAFLEAHRPARDVPLDREWLLENIDYALQARRTFPWAAALDEDLFLNDVLPYAVLDETRERWRPVLFELAAPLVKDASSPAEAAQWLNRDLFKQLGVVYSTQRERANASALETMASGLASCSGLSILYVQACRAVGIPARVAGIALWPDRSGNHAWAEVWDGTQWRFTGAAEYDEDGLDRAWFTTAAAEAVAGHRRHGIWASSWRNTGHHYPLVWNPRDHSVPAVEVTDRYTSGADAEQAAEQAAARDGRLAVRLWATPGGPRLVADVRWVGADGRQTARTFANPDDINLMAEFNAADFRPPVRLEVRVNGETRAAWIDHAPPDGRVLELYWNQLSLSRTAAGERTEHWWNEHAAAVAARERPALEGLVLVDGDFRLRLLRRDFGERPETGHALWISMHGGGGAPAALNDQQWANQIRLYEPEEGILVAPRAPTNEWNLWHRPEIDRFFERLIEAAIVVWGVDPDRVYLLGYSAGGDGVYQLAPRMADRFAAASMMAGHPNDATPHGLRNLPFGLFMGGLDTAYNRNTVAAEWGAQLAALRSADPDGYPHWVEIYPDLGHWMLLRDAASLPWMAGFTRDPWPRRVVWLQGNTPHRRFYWLAVAEQDAVRGRQITATVEGQTIAIESEETRRVELLLHDRLLDLDQPVRIVVNGRPLLEQRVARTEAAIRESLAGRGDPRAIATARLVVSWE